MIIFPAIDIIRGSVVRLYQGNFDQKKTYSEDPVEIAMAWKRKGAQYLHIVDLDGAKEGKLLNKEIILDIIKKVGISCEVGGGLRNESDIKYYLENGVKRVILGTRAFEDKDFLKKIVSKFKERIVLSIDFMKGVVKKSGWMDEIKVSPLDMIKDVKALGVRAIVVTDISTDGTLKGPNIEMIRSVLDSTDIKVIASGGVSSLEDIKKLKALNNKNLEGVIVGKALYEGKIDLKEAISIGAD